MAALTVSKEEEKRLKGLGFLNNRGTDNFSARVITRNGKITAKQQIKLGEAAEKFGNGIVTFTTRLTVEVQGIPYEKIEAFRAFIGEAGLETGGTGPKVRPVVSCKGTTCQYGLLDTFALSEEIHEKFYLGYRSVKLPHKFKIAVGGCPNKCVKPDLNDLGIIGQVVPKYNAELCKGCKKCAAENTCPMGAASMKDGVLEIDEEKCIHCGRCVRDCLFQAVEKEVSGYKVYIGGRWGKKSAAGQALSKIFTTKEEVLAAVEKTILLYKEQGNQGERFADTVARLGFENVEAQIISDEILSRKDEILKRLREAPALTGEQGRRFEIMKFTKMQGIGNDYVYVNCLEEQVENPAEAAVKVSDRHFGIGSDGLILIKPSEKADFEMEMYNADGSQGAMCGNGIRCVAKYVYDYGLTDKTNISVDTKSGIKYLELFVKDGKAEEVKVNMGAPVLKTEEIPMVYNKDQVLRQPLNVNENIYEVTAVSMGNPHAVVYMEDVKNLDIEEVGPWFEKHDAFPESVNTEFVRVIDRNTVEMRVWERGSGETLACGTGACAVAVASILNGYTEDHVTVKLLGGDLKIFWDRKENLVYMTGPAEVVFDGEIAL